MTDSLDILLVLRACAENYPPTVNQANLLAQHGLRVGMVDLSQSGVTPGLDPGVKRWQAHEAWNSKTEAPRSLFKRCANWLGFRQICQEAIRSHCPKVVLAYDILGSAVVPTRQALYRTIYHFHELPEVHSSMGLATKWALAKANRCAGEADLVVFSDKHRAESYQQTARLPIMPLVVMNCPLRTQTIPQSQLRALLRERGFADSKVVCYVGSIGLDKGIGEIAISMQDWPANSLFVLIGPSAQPVKDRIFSLAQEVGTADRVVFLGQKTHSEAMALAAGGDLGVALIQPTTRNWFYSAGAINKRFEYMSLGLPQVTNTGPGVAELIEKTDCGICVEPDSPSAIGRAINQLLGDDCMRQRMAGKCRQLHLEEFYYERQFKPVLEWIQETLS